MTRSTLIPLVLAASVGLVACGEQSPVQPSSPDFAAAAKPQPVSDPTANFSFPLADGALALRSDHLAAYTVGSNSVYANGVCGVTGKIFATTAASNSGDATLQTDNPKASDHSCAAYPRKLSLDFGDGIEVGTLRINTREIHNTSYSIPLGMSVRRKLVVANSARCGNVVFGGDLYGDSVMVTRVSASEWHVQSQPSPNDSVLCLNTGLIYHIPVDFTITSSRALP
jgi:hypothetical protein